MAKNDNKWTRSDHREEGKKMRAHFGKFKGKIKQVRATGVVGGSLGRVAQKAAAEGRKMNRLMNEFIRSLTPEAKRDLHEKLDKSRIWLRREPKYMAIPNWLLRDNEKNPDECKITYPGRKKSDLEALEQVYGIDLRIGEMVRVPRKSHYYPEWRKEQDRKAKLEREKEDAEEMALKAAAGQVIDFPLTKKEKVKQQRAEKKIEKKEAADRNWEAAQQLYEKLFPNR